MTKSVYYIKQQNTYWFLKLFDNQNFYFSLLNTKNDKKKEHKIEWNVKLHILKHNMYKH